MSWKSAILASAVAGMFVAGGAGAAFADEEKKSEAEKVKCEGVNECRGHGACKSARNACAGQNGCGGQGFLMMTAEECEKAKAAKKKE
jgi:uncharacterized membrane protein